MTRKECIDNIQKIIDENMDKILVRVHVGNLIHAVKYMKEQEPVEPILHYLMNRKIQKPWYLCGVCSAGILKGDKYCHECGTKIKWE